MSWLESITNSMDMSFSKSQEILQFMGLQKVGHDLATGQHQHSSIIIHSFLIHCIFIRVCFNEVKFASDFIYKYYIKKDHLIFKK